MSEALIIVDYQKDFIEGGSLGVTGAKALSEYIRRRVDEIRANGGLVIATRDWHPDATVHFDAWPVHCKAGEDGAEYGDIETDKIDVEIFKGFMNSNDGFSGFEGVTRLDGSPKDGFEKAKDAETLEEVLVKARIRIVRIVGLATDFCVKATALSAIELKRAGVIDEVIVETKGIAAVNLEPGAGDRAIEEMREAGVVIA